MLLDLNKINIGSIKSRILTSRPAQKFFDPEKTEFDARDMDICTQLIECDFVMEVNKNLPVPKIIKTHT